MSETTGGIVLQLAPSSRVCPSVSWLSNGTGAAPSSWSSCSCWSCSSSSSAAATSPVQSRRKRRPTDVTSTSHLPLALLCCSEHTQHLVFHCCVLPCKTRIVTKVFCVNQELPNCRTFIQDLSDFVFCCVVHVRLVFLFTQLFAVIHFAFV